MAHMLRRFAAVVLVLLAALPLAARELVPGHIAITPDTVLAEMNRYRAEHSLPPLQLEERLTAAADDRIRDMEELGYWSHESPDGRSPFLWLRVHSYPYQFAGENLASGFETAEVLTSSWMESPGHRDNILSANYTDCGIAVIDGSTTGRAIGKSIVVLFGKQRPSSMPVTRRASTDRLPAATPSSRP
jgi:hypothetical protein